MVTGHIRPRKTKSGKVSYQLVFESERNPINGERQRMYETVKGTKKDAEKRLNTRLYELNNGGVISKPSALKLSDWMMEWHRLYTAHLSPTTRAGYKQQIEFHIVKELGNIPLKDLKVNDVQAWVNDLSNQQGLSAQTVKNIFLNLQSALKVAKKQKMICENPCDDVILPSIKQYQAKVYDIQEIQKMLEISKGTDMYLILVIEVYLGVRKGEIAALKWSDIDLENGVVHIKRSRVPVNGDVIEKAPKSDAGIRDIWLGDEALKIFIDEHNKYLAETKKVGFKATDYVIHTKNGEAYAPDSISQKWERFRDSNNLPKIRFHDLRHTCATMMIAAGVDPKTVQTRLGHSDVQITLNTYSHCLPSMNKAAGNTMDMLFK